MNLKLSSNKKEIAFNDIVYLPKNKQLFKNNENIYLTQIQLNLFELFINNKKYILTAKEHLRFYDGNYENWVEEIDVVGPKWIHAESSFKSVPVKYVIANFEMQYGVKINYPNKYEKIKFSGSFTHNDIDIALKSIFTPLNLTYSNNGIGNIVVSE